MTDKTALSYWLPKLEAAGLPVPKTTIVPAPVEALRDIYRVFDGEAMAGALSGMMEMPLSLKGDGTFSMVLVVIPIEGTWFVEGNKITLEFETMMGMTQAEMTNQDPSISDEWESMVLTVLEDGTLEAVDPNNPSSVTIFARK